jgi:HD-GYP domain-containing protein (c-di-GMP phosphodiesterase class II)
VNLKIQANEQKIFADWIYTASMVLILLFLLGYITVGIAYVAMPAATLSNLIVASILLLGSVFVCTMVITLKRMSAAISKKTAEIIKTLVNTIEAKDQYTQGHSVHVAGITELIYNHLPEKIKHKISRSVLTDAAILHDIGKIGIADNILNKPDKLTAEERKIIEQHPQIGKNILEHTSYQSIVEAIYCHHERIDGKGYFNIPSGKIPLEAKIIAIADTFSALCTDRVYRPKKTYDDAIRIIREAAGTQLDIELVDIFCSIPKKEFEDEGVISCCSQSGKTAIEETIFLKGT